MVHRVLDDPAREERRRRGVSVGRGETLAEGEVVAAPAKAHHLADDEVGTRGRRRRREQRAGRHAEQETAEAHVARYARDRAPIPPGAVAA